MNREITLKVKLHEYDDGTTEHEVFMYDDQIYGMTFANLSDKECMALKVILKTIIADEL